LHHGIADRHLRIEQGLLRQESDPHVGHRHRFAVEFAIFAGHDAQKARLAGAVQPEHADLRAREERQRDVFQDHPLGRHHLAHAIHRVNVLRHRIPSPCRDRCRRSELSQARVARFEGG
jgi:hypothetical protein